MLKNWTAGLRRCKKALDENFYLRVALTAYSFVSLLLIAPAVGDASIGEDAVETVTLDAPARVALEVTSSILPGGDPAAREIEELESKRILSEPAVLGRNAGHEPGVRLHDISPTGESD